MTENPRDSIHVKYGTVEIETTGSPEDVKARFDAFLDLLKTLPPAALPVEPKATIQPIPQQADTQSLRNDNGSGDSNVSQEVLSRVFRVSGSIVSLLALPRGDNVAADACLMLLYGFARLLNATAVTGVSLKEACRQSGVPMGRLDRVMDSQTDFVNAGGLRRAKRYSLNNPGTRRAASLVAGLV